MVRGEGLNPLDRKENKAMKNIIEAIESKTIESYGFEAKRTIITFKATEVLRKIFKI